MCCFSRSILHVANTRILARPCGDDRQLLVYAMNLTAAAELAMVLPIPVPPGSPEDAVKFVDLSACPRFFDQVEQLFPVAPVAGDLLCAPQPAARSAPLVVHDVGEFEASFVPTTADFARLDPRFRLPPRVFDALPQYADWGFSVFKLKAGAAMPVAEPGVLDRIRGLFGAAPFGGPPNAIPAARDYHPMAFEFPRRDPSTLFLPTVHVHDGEVHPEADFDHTLYVQGPPVQLAGWDRSTDAAAKILGSAKTWLDVGAAVQRKKLVGRAPNQDEIVPLAG